MAQPLPNGVYPQITALGYSDIYVVGSDNNLYQLSTYNYISSGTATPLCALTDIYVAFIALNETYDKLYISDPGSGSIWVVDLGTAELTQIVTGLSNPTGLAVYDGYLYVTINTFNEAEQVQIDLIQINLNTLAQVSLIIGSPDTYYSYQMVMNSYTYPYCYF